MWQNIPKHKMTSTTLNNYWSRHFLLISQTDEATRVHLIVFFMAMSAKVIVTMATLSGFSVVIVADRLVIDAIAVWQWQQRHISRSWRLLVGASRISDGNVLLSGRSERFSVDFDERPGSVHVQCRWRRRTPRATFVDPMTRHCRRCRRGTNGDRRSVFRRR